MVQNDKINIYEAHLLSVHYKVAYNITISFICRLNETFLLINITEFEHSKLELTWVFRYNWALIGFVSSVWDK